MGLISATVSSAPPIFKLPQPRAHCLHFPRSNLYPWCKMMQSFPVCKRRNRFKVRCSQVKVEESLVDEACELVNVTELTSEMKQTVFKLIFKAVKNNNATGILLLFDILGFEDPATRDFAYRVTCNGYNVLVPNLFNGDPWTKLVRRMDLKAGVA